MRTSQQEDKKLKTTDNKDSKTKSTGQKESKSMSDNAIANQKKKEKKQGTSEGKADFENPADDPA